MQFTELRAERYLPGPCCQLLGLCQYRKGDIHGVRWSVYCDRFHRGLGGFALAMGQLYRKKGSHSLGTPPKVYIAFPSVLNCVPQVKRNKGLCVKVTVS